MADRNSAKVGESFTLEAQFSLSGENADVYSVSKVEIQDRDEFVVETITSVTSLGDGLYRVTVPALVAGGTLYDVWYYTSVANAEEDTKTFEVVVDEPEVEEGEAAEEADTTPDAGSSYVCLVTGRFFDASGNYFQGVWVKFTPNQIVDQVFASGMVAREVAVQSDANGAVSFYLMRGMRGTLTISGIGICREVTVPSTGTVDIFDMINGTDDPLEVQSVDFVSLPRSS